VRVQRLLEPRLEVAFAAARAGAAVIRIAALVVRVVRVRAGSALHGGAHLLLPAVAVEPYNPKGVV
jgi:hypothetical protein